MFRRVPGTYRVTRRGPGHPPGNYMGLMGQEGKHTSHQGLVRPPYGPNEKGEGKGDSASPFPFSPSSFLPPQANMERGARPRGNPSRIRSYLGHLLASPLPLPPIYMWGAPLEALISFPVWPIKAHYFPRRIPVTLRYSEKYPNHSEPFRCPNIAFQYIDFYVSTILRLLVMSVISYGTSNNLRYIKSHNS